VGSERLSHSPETTQQQTRTPTQVAETTAPSCAHLTCPLRAAGRSGLPWPEPPGLPPLVCAGMCPFPTMHCVPQFWSQKPVIKVWAGLSSLQRLQRRVPLAWSSPWGTPGHPGLLATSPRPVRPSAQTFSPGWLCASDHPLFSSKDICRWI